MALQFPTVMLRYAKQIGLPAKDAKQIYAAWVDRLTFAQIYTKMDQAAEAMHEAAPADVIALAREVGYPPTEAERQYASWKKRGLSNDNIKGLIRKYAAERQKSTPVSRKEDVNEAIDPKHLKKIIHNDANVTLGNASEDQLNASKRWYLDRVGHVKVGERKNAEGVQKTYLKNLSLITKELASRK